MPSNFDMAWTPPAPIEIQVQDVIMSMSYNYSRLMVIMSVALLAYVLFNNFVTIKSDKLKAIKKDFDEYMILPALFLTAATVSYFISL